MAKYALEQKRRALGAAATIEEHGMKEKAARQVEMERERMRWELWQAYGGELSHLFMVSPGVES